VKKGRVSTIVALDPAGPGFESENAENRLSKTDAIYVECIHSNGGNLGLMEPLCTTDFYPNFGVKQPGCNFLIRDLCSHSRAWKYFAESLFRFFTANKCESIDEIYNETPCNGTEFIMGGNDYEGKMNTTGIFYFDTNEDPPFAKR
jgi:pancreatic triacylglycerol lipase